MIYVVGVIGFISGFFLGQIILLRLLKDVSTEDLLEDPALRWKYGTINWAIAVLGCVSAIHLFKMWQADQAIPF